MKLWLISQDVNSGYDTYDSAVVAADTSDDARRVSPSGQYKWSDADGCWMFEHSDGRKGLAKNGHQTDWVSDITLVKVREIGHACGDVSSGLVLASFNAG